MGDDMAGTVLTVAQQKGGAGKTTLAAQLATTWAAQGLRVAVVDIDPQGSLSAWHALRLDRLGAEGTGLGFSAVQGYRSAREIERLAEQHDMVVVDSPPHAETEARIAVRAATLVLVPVQPSPLDVWATGATFEMVRREGRPACVVFNRVPPRALLVQDVADRIRALEVRSAAASLGNRVAFAASMDLGLGAVEHEPSGRAAEEIAALAEEIRRLVG